MNDVERDIITLSNDATPEQIGEVRERVRRAVEAAKDLERLLDDRLTDFVRERGELVIGTVRYYLGRKKRTKVIDAAAAMDAGLELSNGDMVVFTRDYLCSEPFKYGNFKRALPPERFAALFKVEEVESLEAGEPRKQLMKVDTRYLG